MTLREWFDDYKVSSNAIIEFATFDDEEIGDFDLKFYEDLCTKYKHCQISDVSPELLDYEFDYTSDYMPCPDFVIYDNNYVYTPVLCVTYWNLIRLNRNPVNGPSKTN